jgi:hypothetical protein
MSRLFLFVAAVALAWPVSAQISADHQPVNLDRLLAAKDYKALGETIGKVSTRDELWSNLGWLKDRMMSGESAYVSMLYARVLWNAAAPLPAKEQSPLRQTAAMATLYAYAAIKIDGTRCGDRSAPAHRVQQLAGWNPEVWSFLASLAEADRVQILTLVPLLEARTAARRDLNGDVEFLCRAGMEEMSYNLSHGTSREVPRAPGQFGRQIVVSGDGKYKPSERPDAEWKPEAAKLRASLPQILAGEVAKLAAPKSAVK